MEAGTAPSERFLVTGAAGCLGAWTVAQLISEGTPVTALDASTNNNRLRLLLDDDQIRALSWIQGDVRDIDHLSSIIHDRSITHLIHLAALQVPACQSDPILGAQVNVVGTVNVLEAVRRSEGQVRGLSFASSAAAFGGPDLYPSGRAADDSPLAPRTLYGVFKQANESAAKVYAADWGVGSVGLRPCIVYGPGRDQGLTSDPTKAMLAAAAGVRGHIAFGGSSTYHHAQDVAAAFVAVTRREVRDSVVLNVGGTDATVEEIAAEIMRVGTDVEVTHGDQPLPIPSALDGSGLDELLGDEVRFRPLAEGVSGTVAQFRRLLDQGLVIAPTD